MENKLLKNIVYVDGWEETERFSEVFPDYLFRDPALKDCTGSVAYATSYRFETYKGISYFVLRLNVWECFHFDKYYAMNVGLNNELFNMLKEIRAIRPYDDHIDFESILDYNFFFQYEKQEEGYIITGAQIDEESYYYNFTASEDSVFADFCK